MSKRISEHKRFLKKNKHCCKHLQNAWNFYGEISFSFSIIEECTNDNLQEREQLHIDKNNGNLYNSVLYAYSGSKGYKHTDEAKKKIQQASLGRKMPPITEERRLFLRMLRLGKPPSNKGELIDINCLMCHKQFQVQPYKVKNGGAKFCSVDCTNKSYIGRPSTSSTKFSKGFIIGVERRFPQGNIPWNKGKKLPPSWNSGTKGKGVMKKNSGSFKGGAFEIVSPEMVLYVGEGISSFVLQMGMSKNIFKMINKEREFYKGWRLPKEGDVYNGVGLFN